MPEIDPSLEASRIPILDSYWVVPGRLMAGEYPGSVGEDKARGKLRWLLGRGVDFFLDLTGEGEAGLKPYASLLGDVAAAAGQQAIYRRLAIADMHTPTPLWMANLLDTLDEALEHGRKVYVHCYGGIGRTGMVVGCYLVRHGLNGEAAIQQIAAWRASTPDGWKRSPETDDQIDMVLNWHRLDRKPG